MDPLLVRLRPLLHVVVSWEDFPEGVSLSGSDISVTPIGRMALSHS